MGQLERYGLYVLVLVIFLILGVAIWGDDPQAPVTPERGRPLDTRVELEPPAEPDPISDALAGHFEVADFEELDAAPIVAPAPVLTQPAVTKPEPAVVVAQAPPVEAAPGEPRGLRDYVIQRGDTLWDIASAKLGSGAQSQIQRILALNPGLDPERLQLGRTIKLPPRFDAKAAGAGGVIHVVQDGENPSTIAQKRLGSQRYAKAIMDANGIDDPLMLKPGMELVIPAVEKD